MHGQFVWYDLMTSDPAAAQRFYPPLTGWKTQKFEQSKPDMPYTMWTSGGAPLGGVAQITREQSAMGAKPSWLPSVEVSNIDQSAQKVTSLGGKVIHGPEGIPDMGRYAIIQDPQGATISIYQPKGPGSGFDGTPKLGQFSWNELMTTDLRRAFDFYRQLFGWEKTGEEMDMGGGNMYLMYGQKGKMYGGIYNREAAAMPNMPPNCLPYIYVKDIKQTVDAAKRAGGILGRGPMDIPGGGQIAILADPQGARFALHQGPSSSSTSTRAARPASTAAKKKSKPKAKARPKAKKKSRPKAKARPKARAKKKSAKKARRR
jgi:predicted enzyme related to lactoylglutathione lyase